MHLSTIRTLILLSLLFFPMFALATSGTILTVTAASDTSNNLSWTAPTNIGTKIVATYKIFRNDTLIKTVKGTVLTYLDTGLTASTTYKYRVQPCDANNLCWLSSNVVTQSLTPAADTQPPSVPQDVTATAISASQINLSWTASSDNIGVTSYKIYRNGVLLVTLGNVLLYSDPGLAASTLYSYTLVACDAAGNCSAQSLAVSATTLAVVVIQAPKLTVSAINASNVKINWMAPIGIDGIVSSYNIYRNGVLIKTVLGSVLSFLDQDVLASTTYGYQITPCGADNVCWLSSDLITITTPATTSSSTETASPVISDCVFTWLEGNYPDLLAPASAESKSFPPYYYRYYSVTNSYIATSSNDNQVYYMGALSGNRIMDVGSLDKWKQMAGCNTSSQGYVLGGKGPAGGIVFYIDDSGKHGLEAQPADYNNSIGPVWQDAVIAGSSYGAGWRLPTKSEIVILQKQESVVGGFVSYPYWSFTEVDANNAWCQNFKGGAYGTSGNALGVCPKSYMLPVRAIRQF